jgi:hypothetical protein
MAPKVMPTAQGDANGCRDRRGDNGNLKRDTRSMDDTTQQITTELIGTQGEFPAGRQQALAQVLFINPLRRDKVCRQSRQ